MKYENYLNRLIINEGEELDTSEVENSLSYFLNKKDKDIAKYIILNYGKDSRFNAVTNRKLNKEYKDIYKIITSNSKTNKNLSALAGYIYEGTCYFWLKNFFKNFFDVEMTDTGNPLSDIFLKANGKISIHIQCKYCNSENENSNFNAASIKINRLRNENEQYAVASGNYTTSKLYFFNKEAKNAFLNSCMESLKREIGLAEESVKMIKNPTKRKETMDKINAIKNNINGFTIEEFNKFNKIKFKKEKINFNSKQLNKNSEGNVKVNSLKGEMDIHEIIKRCNNVFKLCKTIKENNYYKFNSGFGAREYSHIVNYINKNVNKKDKLYSNRKVIKLLNIQDLDKNYNNEIEKIKKDFNVSKVDIIILKRFFRTNNNYSKEGFESYIKNLTKTNYNEKELIENGFTNKTFGY